MPCDRVYSTSVNFGNLKVDDLDLLIQALEDEGYVVQRVGGRITARHTEHGTLTYDAATGAVKQEAVDGQQTAQDLDEVKVAYSRRVVGKVATRFGWSVKEVNATGVNVVAAFDATKRGF